MTNSDNDDVEYCAECGDPEFDKDGNETHADEDKYDHDFEPEEDEEEESVTLGDVKDLADTVKSVVEAGRVLKNIPQVPPRKEGKSEEMGSIKKGIDRIEDGIEHGKRTERKRWIIGLGISAVIAIIITLLL